MRRRVILVEDDRGQAEAIEKALVRGFPELVVSRIATESEFRKRLDEMAQSSPELIIIMDVMLRWADPDPEMELPPEEVQREKHYRAGLRCERLLSERAETRKIPVLLHTILDPEDLEEQWSSRDNVVYVPKSKTMDPLLEQMQKMLRRPSPAG